MDIWLLVMEMGKRLTIPPRCGGVNLRSITREEYLFGDFDRDGVMNIDDAAPFDRSRGQATEVSLGSELLFLKAYGRQYRRGVEGIRAFFERYGYETKGRVKTPESLINKFRRKYLDYVTDVGGVQVLVDTLPQVYEVADLIQRNFDVVEVEDYYKHPKPDGYMALHFLVRYGGRIYEIQVKRRSDYEKHLKWHKEYKERGLEKFGLGRGWHGESERHSEAAKKGWRRRRR